MFDIFITANCFNPLDVRSCIYHEGRFEGRMAHMTKTKTTKVLNEYPPTRAGRASPLPDHAGPSLLKHMSNVTKKLKIARKV